jgi:carbon-monoxide dehydrogenase medium subunit
VASKLIVERAFPLAQAAWEVGAPQIRNRGTIAGNLITASPANDTITPLMALGASVTLLSKQGERVVPLQEFYTGVRRTVMQPDEMLVDIAFPAMRANQRGTFYKLGLRRAQAISLVDAAVLLTFENDVSGACRDQMVRKAVITLGSVAPTIIRATSAETYLSGRPLTDATLQHTAELAVGAAHPIDDVRSGADYRREMVRVCTLRGLRALAQGDETSGFPERPVLLWGKVQPGEVAHLEQPARHTGQLPIVTRINGKDYTFSSGYRKTLLDLLREEAGLIGTKEGCAEGECGACTVFLDGMAVMSCLVPAPRAHGAEIVTVEGLALAAPAPVAQNESGNGYLLHPVQQAFIDEGAVQCGYCTPGFLMSAAKLLEERPEPSRDDIRQAITGNLCRCTGYYKIVTAIERAAQIMAGTIPAGQMPATLEP